MYAFGELFPDKEHEATLLGEVDCDNFPSAFFFFSCCCCCYYYSFFFQERHARWWAFPLVTLHVNVVVAGSGTSTAQKVSYTGVMTETQVDTGCKSRKMWFLWPLCCAVLCCHRTGPQLLGGTVGAQHTGAPEFQCPPENRSMLLLRISFASMCCLIFIFFIISVFFYFGKKEEIL